MAEPGQNVQETHWMQSEFKTRKPAAAESRGSPVCAEPSRSPSTQSCVCPLFPSYCCTRPQSHRQPPSPLHPTVLPLAQALDPPPVSCCSPQLGWAPPSSTVCLEPAVLAAGRSQRCCQGHPIPELAPGQDPGGHGSQPTIPRSKHIQPWEGGYSKSPASDPQRGHPSLPGERHVPCGGDCGSRELTMVQVGP